MGASRLVLVALVLGGCSTPKAKPDLADVSVPATSVAAARAMVPAFQVLPPKCAPTEICPIYPDFPDIKGFSALPNACITGADRVGCRTENGWQFTPKITTSPPAASGRRSGLFSSAPKECGLDEYGYRVELANGQTLFWSETSGTRRLLEGGGCRELPALPFAKLDLSNRMQNGMDATSVADVWAWSGHELMHFDGAGWTSTALQSPCAGSLNDEFASAVVDDDAIWFSTCDANPGMAKHPLVRLDRKTGRAMRDPRVDEVEAFVPSAPNGILVTAWTGSPRTRHQFRLTPSAIANDETVSEAPVRVAFDDGTMIRASNGFFGAVDRFEDGTWTTVIANRQDGKALFAPNRHSIWAGGEELWVWDGKRSSVVAYRPDHAKARITAMSGQDPNEVWVASILREEDSAKTRLSHWNGKAWTQQELVTDDLLERALSFAVVSPTEAWLLTNSHLWRWDGKSWTVAAPMPWSRGWLLTVVGDSLYISGDSTIYRRAR